MLAKSFLRTDVNHQARGRFAPSPTGRMHLGNVCAALVSWLSVKIKGGKWILRIEDIDSQRSREQYARLIEDDLDWLGLDWDEGGYDESGSFGPFRQSLRTEYYEEVLESLRSKGLVYDCRCTRAELRAASAPHADDGRVLYSGRCRPQSVADNWNRLCEGLPPLTLPDDFGRGAARIYAPDLDICFDDMICGPQSFNLAKECGDFVLRRRDGEWAYQLAVVADDVAMGITEIVRGEDLLLSAAQQIYLMRLLGAQSPQYAHFPLLRNAAGQRLSKRDGAMSLEELRTTQTPSQIIGTLAGMTGIMPDSTPVTPSEILSHYLRSE